MIEFLKGYLDLRWHKKRDILLYLRNYGIKIHERKFRQFVEDYNREYYDGLHDSYIVHSQKGYLLTSDKDLIKKSIADDESRLIALSKRVYGVKRRLKYDNQLSILPDDELMNAYEVISKVEVW